jgi:ferric-dicitrate binding protein FerR (iron transport regulator)
LSKDIDKLVDFLFDENPKQLKKFINNQKNSQLDNSEVMDVYRAFENTKANGYSDYDKVADYEKISNNIKKTNHRKYRNLIKIASVIIVFLIAYLYIDINEQKDIKYNYYITNKDETARIQLNDGTNIYIEENTKLSVPQNYEANCRNVKIKGKAYFEVKHNPESIFTLESEKYKINVLGTKFRVVSIDSLPIMASLYQGKIEVDLTGYGLGKEILKPNDNLIFDRKSKRVSRKIYSQNLKVDWLNKTLKFEDVTLSKIIKDLSIYYNKQIVLNNNEIEDKIINVTFKNRNLEESLRSLKKICRFEIEQTAEGSFKLN